ncbi:MAG: hypothetical protein ACYC8T_08720 [Myxococcaceae bacterium]
MVELKQADVVRQIGQAWENAQEQLAELREQVTRTTELAMAKTQSTFLERDKDRALRNLGEAVWSQVQKGKLALPASLREVARAMEEVQKKIEAEQRDIADLLREGEEAVARRTKSALAARAKKR